MQTATESSEQTSFRAHCRAWLAARRPAPPDFRLPQGPLEIATTQQLEWLCAWQRSAYEAGLVGCDYPTDVGGGGLVGCQWIANQELQASGAPFFPNVVGLGMAAPTIFNHGTPEQKKLIKPLLAGDEIWCQGFSEPNAGSDLANVQTSARPDNGRWILNGHKVWTTLAHFAKWMILLARSERSKYAGLTYFIVPIADGIGRGVTVRPLIKMTGELGFNEVLFEDYPVDDALRLDDAGRGWDVAMTTLLHERGAGPLVTPRSGGTVGDESSSSLGAAGLVDLARRTLRDGRPASDDPLIRDRIIKILIRQRAFAQSDRRAGVPALTDHPLRIPLQHKLNLSELMQDTAALACDIAGMAATLHHTDEHAPAGGRWPLAHMNSYGFTIAAGTSEVLRNILGERVLGLAKTK